MVEQAIDSTAATDGLEVETSFPSSNPAVTILRPPEGHYRTGTKNVGAGAG
mgnify:FL=1